MSAELSTPLSDEELEELEQFLLSEAVSDEAMVLDTLDGYLTAIVIGPVTILPSRWLPGISGESEDDAPVYESMEQAQRILELVMRHMNGIIGTLQYDADAFDPLLDSMVYGEGPREYLEDGRGSTPDAFAFIGPPGKLASSQYRDDGLIAEWTPRQ